MAGRAKRPVGHKLLTNMLYGPVVQFRDIRYLWACSLFNGIGSMGEAVVLGWVLLEITNSPFMVGLGLGLRMAPNFFLGILAGAVADRVDRLTLMKLMPLGIAANSTVLGILIFTDRMELWHLFTLTVVGGSFSSLYWTARQSFTYDVAGPTLIVSSLAFVSLGMLAGGIVGSLLAGYVAGRLGTDWAFFMMAGSYVLSVIPLFLIQSRGQAAPVSRKPVWQNLKEFGAEIRRNNSFRTVFLLVAMVEMLGFSHMAVLPSLARDVLDVDAEGLGVMNAFRSVGGFLGITVISAWGEPRRKGLSWIIVLGLLGGAIVALGTASTFLLAIVAITLVSGLTALSDIFSQGLMQTLVPNELRGRAMGAWNVAIGTMPLGNLQIGALAGVLTVGFALVANGVGLAVLAVGGFALLSGLRKS
jgi:MFS family permease